MVQKTVNILHYRDVGAVSYVRSTRARNLAIRINQQGEIRVTIPRFVSQRQAERFFVSKQTWVRKKLDSLKTPDCRQSQPGEGDNLQIRGKMFPVRLQGGKDTVEAALWRIIRREAIQYLPARLTRLSDVHGYRFTGLKIRNMKTRWGSCTSKKGINLNSWLVMLPEHLSDYVILHELVHTKIPNHGKEFWDELDRVSGGQAKELRKELRGHQIMCFPQQSPDQ
jgi:predicted metal-dependent hydrolase